MTSTSTEFYTRDAQPDERDAIIALTLAAYAQYEAIMPRRRGKSTRPQFVTRLSPIRRRRGSLPRRAPRSSVVPC